VLIKHSFQYLIARGLPGIINFLALALYTRLLAPDEFGRYALVLAGVGLVDVFLFQWLRLVVDRFLATHRESSQEFLGGVLAQFSVIATIVAGVGLLGALTWSDHVWQRLLALAVPLTLSFAFFELTLVVLKAELRPGAYGQLLGSKTLIALVTGGFFAWVGLGAMAPLLGLMIGQVLAMLFMGWAIWRKVKWSWPDSTEWGTQLKYGLPLVLTFALGWVISASDRWLIAWLIDDEAVGQYTATYDLAFQALTLLLTIINTAAFPLAVRALESSGETGAKKQLQHNGELIIVAALSGSVALIVLTPSIINLIIGDAFRNAGISIFPIVIAAAALSGIKAFHFDIAFHLGRQSQWLVGITSLAAIVNVILNIFLIPKFGIIGSAWATVIAYGVALITSALFGRHVFTMPSLWPLVVKGIVIGFFAGFSATLGASIAETHLLKVFIGLMAASFITLILIYLLNINDLRKTFPIKRRPLH